MKITKVKSFEEIYNMNNKERKENQCSLVIDMDEVGLPRATWCQIIGGMFIIKQSYFDEKKEYFTNYVGNESTIIIKDMSVITDIYTSR